MLFILVGIVLIVLNLTGVTSVRLWTWNVFGDLWKFCLPFALAALWWAWADKSGLNKRREIERMERKKQDRRKNNLEALGLDARARRKPPPK